MAEIFDPELAAEYHPERYLASVRIDYIDQVSPPDLTRILNKSHIDLLDLVEKEAKLIEEKRKTESI